MPEAKTIIDVNKIADLKYCYTVISKIYDSNGETFYISLEQRDNGNNVAAHEISFLIFNGNQCSQKIVFYNLQLEDLIDSLQLIKEEVMKNGLDIK